MLRFVFLLLILNVKPLYICASDYQFAGKHFFASYLECDEEALRNIDNLINAMDNAVTSSGATILNKCSHTFPPTGLTLVYLLSESHASIHTYPEFNACFIDLFTCGDSCSSEKFDTALRAYLKPKQVTDKLFLRHHSNEECLK
jgi:S-adenosylmethionine decarboxylase